MSLSIGDGSSFLKEESLIAKTLNIQTGAVSWRAVNSYQPSARNDMVIVL